MKLDRRNMTHATTRSYELRLTCSISNIYLQWRRQVLEVKGANIWGVDGGTEGPERGAECRGGWGLGRGAVAPPKYGV